MKNQKKKVFVMMSGGVDSSVAAFLLKKNSKYDVIGAFIKGYNIDGCQEKDAADARRAAQHLGIPFYTIDLEKDYKKMVVDYMIDGYRKGITPNPDVMCNREIKFGLFLEKALELGADYVATGHYVRIVTNNQQPITNNVKRTGKMTNVKYQMFAAKDQNKDQSYFLWTLTQDQLNHCLFPIGDYLKSEVRAIAKKAGLLTAEKKDSQGICFLGQFNVKDFLKQFLPVKKGAITDMGGKKLGKHDGAWFYTIGQRHGLNLGKREKGSERKGENLPYYIVGKDIKKNTVIVAEGDSDLNLFKNEMELSEVNFISSQELEKDREVLARVRYRQPLGKAKFIKLKNKKYKLIFEKPQKAPASGQSAVLYGKEGEMIGGGVIG